MKELKKLICESEVKINKLFAGLVSVRIVKNCDLALENAARGPSGSYRLYNHLITLVFASFC